MPKDEKVKEPVKEVEKPVKADPFKEGKAKAIATMIDSEARVMCIKDTDIDNASDIVSEGLRCSIISENNKDCITEKRYCSVESQQTKFTRRTYQQRWNSAEPYHIYQVYLACRPEQW
jgi:hypothetical protein